MCEISCFKYEGFIQKSSLSMQLRTTYKVVTDVPEPQTATEILDRAGEHILLTEIMRGMS